ncbi:cupin [Loktanella sp. 3ANDIMAR09]|uniref:cupin domain-containing protein n=1 Tax=Loktanella sp. 3ANDIMAR09 TaxID=1225657 RepID=UPI0006FF6CFF|nr:cupin domain-containing protein [Loktanella sp. 3ANDIMAR09]KQI68972.1 cupin [Loktanella sp. 3ANDIMAR09]
MTETAIRRVVTGHDRMGRAVVCSDGDLPHVIRPPAQPGLAFHEVWHTAQCPARITFTQADPTHDYRDTAPPPGGTIIRFVDIPPEGHDGPDFDAKQAEALFAAVGLAENAAHTIKGRHPLMHRTESVDYGIVIAGEITLLLDDAEVTLHPGDVVVQRGTIHAWANRSDASCRMLFVLTDGTFDPALRAAQVEQDARVKSQA